MTFILLEGMWRYGILIAVLRVIISNLNPSKKRKNIAVILQVKSILTKIGMHLMTTIQSIPALLNSTGSSTNLVDEELEQSDIQTINNQANSTLTSDVLTDETLNISTRSQNIQKLNEEFFSNGIQGFKVTNEFIDRLAQYGLISEMQAKELGSTVVTATSENTESDSLNENVKSLIEQLSILDAQEVSETQQESENGLIAPLTSALEIMARIDDDLLKPTSTEINEVRNQIKEQQENGTTSDLGQLELDTLKQLDMMLSVAENLTPNTLNSSAINSYLKHMA